MATPDDTSASIPAEEVIRLLIAVPRAANGYEIVVTPAEAILFLSMSASEFWNTPCDDPHCEVCYEFVTSWKSLYQALDAVDRGSVETYLEERDTRPPAFPQSLR